MTLKPPTLVVPGVAGVALTPGVTICTPLAAVVVAPPLALPALPTVRY